MVKLAISSVGKDRPGIVAAFTRVLFEFGCNIEDSSMTILYNQFAMILIVSLPDKSGLDDLKMALSKVEEDFRLSTSIKILEDSVFEDQPGECKSYIVRVCGCDQAGIAYHVTDILAKYKVNIVDFNSKLISKTKKPVYLMMIETQISSCIDFEAMRSDLNRVVKDLNIELSIEEIDCNEL